ncbi:MAG: pyrroloquinoline quinone biosynthesis peptide chaperone PqqD [Pseudomonadota bacterium]
MELDPASVPAIRTHYRFQWEPAQESYVLLYPEGMIKLNGSAGEILSCCDGDKTIDDIIIELQNKFPEAESLPSDTHEFLKIAHDKRWIEFNQQ